MRGEVRSAQGTAHAGAMPIDRGCGLAFVEPCTTERSDPLERVRERGLDEQRGVGTSGPENRSAAFVGIEQLAFFVKRSREAACDRRSVACERNGGSDEPRHLHGTEALVKRKPRV